jgi:NAD(P)-dependent dehydrogenase (short-subunit alcohol dehydrogenase family)
MSNKNTNLFSGKVALITGASSGIGKATAFLFAQNGVRTVLTDISEADGQKVAAEIVKTFDTPSVFIKCDVSKSAEVKKLIEQTVSHFGRLDYAFNNAGIEGITNTTSECTEENWDKTINTNLKGVWLCMKYEIEQILKQGHGGAIVNCSSIAGLVGFTGIPAYSASKHGVLGLTKTAALEYAKSGIRINAVCPGVIETPMIDRFTGGDPKAAAQMSASEPIGRMGHPEEIAEAVFWLCSERSSFVTGHSLVADGGWVAQ